MNKSLLEMIMGQSTFDSWLRSLNPAIWLPLARMSKGMSPNLVTWNGSAPSTGWDTLRATLSDETTPTPPVSAKCLRILCADPEGLGAAYGYYAISSYAKYAGITATLKLYTRAPATNVLTPMASVYSPSSAVNVPCDDTWRLQTTSSRLKSAPSSLWIIGYNKDIVTANTTDILYFDNPGITFPQVFGWENIKGIYHPDSSLPLGLFDGVDDLCTCETDPIGAQACIIMATIRPTALNTGATGRIADNSKLFVSVSSSYGSFTNAVIVSSDGTTTLAGSGDNSIAINNTYRIVVGRTAAGLVTIGINGKVSGAVNQNSGTPAAGISLLTIGNRLAGDRSFTGNIYDIETIVGAPAVQIYNRFASFCAQDYERFRRGN